MTRKAQAVQFHKLKRGHVPTEREAERVLTAVREGSVGIFHALAFLAGEASSPVRKIANHKRRKGK